MYANFGNGVARKNIHAKISTMITRSHYKLNSKAQVGSKLATKKKKNKFAILIW
jgi:hypothetical protein